jgi:hypothetical protein
VLYAFAVVAFWITTRGITGASLFAYEASRFAFATIVFGRLLYLFGKAWLQSNVPGQQPPSAKPSVYSVPRRFSLASIFLLTVAFALLAALVHWLRLPPAWAVGMMVFFALVGLLQLTLHRTPRQASMLAGCILFPPVGTALIILSDPTYAMSPFSDLAFHAACWSIAGAAAGYVMGTLVGGVFMLADWTAALTRAANGRHRQIAPEAQATSRP